jgi:molybdenum cofactor cytidylyltransferase
MLNQLFMISPPAEKVLAKKISAVILAAGKSSRAAGFKPLLKWGGEPLIEKTYRSLSETRSLGEIVIVTGFQSEELEQSLLRLGARSILNKKYESGMLSSIQHGLSALSLDWDAALIALVDQPQLEVEDYRFILETFSADPRNLGRPFFAGKAGNPAILGRKYLNEILSAPESDRGCASLFSKYPGDTISIEMCNDRCLHDFDREEDLIAYRASLGSE